MLPRVDRARRRGAGAGAILCLLRAADDDQRRRASADCHQGRGSISPDAGGAEGRHHPKDEAARFALSQ